MTTVGVTASRQQAGPIGGDVHEPRPRAASRQGAAQVAHRPLTGVADAQSPLGPGRLWKVHKWVGRWLSHGCLVVEVLGAASVVHGGRSCKVSHSDLSSPRV